MGASTGARLAAGLVTFRDGDFPWTLWYDEVLCCHRVEGAFELEVDGVARPMNPGDMAWIPAGTSLTYRVRGEAVLFYAVTPADWVNGLPGPASPRSEPA